MGQIKSVDDFVFDDFCCNVLCFSFENFEKNLVLVDCFKVFVDKKGCMLGQLVFVWLLVQGDDIILIFGMKKLKYLEENFGLLKVYFIKEEVQEIREEVEKVEVVGYCSFLGLFNEYMEIVEF